MLGTRQGEIAHDIQAVPASRSPTGYDADHHLGHEADQPLTLEDV